MLVAFALKAQDDALVTIIDTTLYANLLALFQLQLFGLKVGNVLLSYLGKLDKLLHGVIRYRQILLLVREGGFSHIYTIFRFVVYILLQCVFGTTGENQS